jgi:hypothetical protein
MMRYNARDCGRTQGSGKPECRCNGWVRGRKTLWVDGNLVNGNWNDDNSKLYLDNGSVDSTNPNNGPRQKFLQKLRYVAEFCFGIKLRIQLLVSLDA